jgi:hypothetical protein
MSQILGGWVGTPDKSVARANLVVVVVVVIAGP